MPTNLSNLVGSNLKFASVALTAAAQTDSPLFNTGSYLKIPFNAVLDNPYGILTLNTSLSTVTLPAGLYSTTVTLQSFRSTIDNIIVSTRISVDGAPKTKWPKYKLVGTQASSAPEPHAEQLTPAGLYLPNSSNTVALEQYWTASGKLQGSDINDGSSSFYYRMDFWKLR